jgi:hypothetical protein
LVSVVACVAGIVGFGGGDGSVFVAFVACKILISGVAVFADVACVFCDIGGEDDARAAGICEVAPKGGDNGD